ncbi:MAG: right-handed parallel beta-helix repeat-containing protein [Planctomycetota bacterium]|jgi:parallel beta-helix repeat protein
MIRTFRNFILILAILPPAIVTALGGGIYLYGNSNPEIFNCVISDNINYGIFLNSSGPSIVVSNCIINNNTSSGIGNMWHGLILNCTVVKNGNYGLKNYTESRIENCIIWGNSAGQLSNPYEPTYNCVQGGYPGIGNIDGDPCFVNFDANDFHLLPNSPCIDAGDPGYIAEPNETDLDGRPRVIDGRIDMGAYEFLLNTIPIADAGPNQIAYAWIDDIADVNLDGSNSYDVDGDPLNCLWTWIIDSNIYEANGISPTIQLPVGEHTVTLIVTDGYEDSEPNDVVITVTEPVETSLKLTPGVINRDTSGPQEITGRLDINPDVDTDLLNLNALLTIYPGEVPALEQRLMGRGRGMQSRSCIIASFDKQELLDAVNENGYAELTAVGQLITGQYIFASDIVLIKFRNR